MHLWMRRAEEHPVSCTAACKGAVIKLRHTMEMEHHISSEIADAAASTKDTLEDAER